MTLSDFILATQWFFLLNFLLINGVYLLLQVVASVIIVRYTRQHSIESAQQLYSGFELPVSLLAPAYNEEGTIAASVRSLLQLNYPEYEVIVINDGSSDSTLEVLIQEFALLPHPEAYRVQLATQPVKCIYRSTRYANLRVVDKRNGGKADALNAGINCSRFPLFCAMDADSILPRDSLQRIARPFMEDTATVAVGGIVRIVNGCEVRDGHLVKTGLPRNLWALIQVIEYLRVFLFGRMGWEGLNAILVISGAFGMFRKGAVIAVGGYRHNTIGEDMELVVRLHRLLRQRKRPYRIHFIPDPICWTEAPEDFRTLRNQRIRWQRGLAESLAANMGLMFNPRGGLVGWLAFPFAFFFELLSPIIECAGYVIMTLAFAFDMIAADAYWAFMLLIIGLGILQSATALLLEEMTYKIYPNYRDLLRLCGAILIENFGYRQLNSYWRIIGTARWLFNSKSGWGKMKRSAKWSSHSKTDSP